MIPSSFRNIILGITVILVWSEFLYPAVTTDDQLWLIAGLEKKWSTHFTTELEIQTRLRNHYRDHVKTFTEFSVQVRTLKHVHFTPGIRYGTAKTGTFYRGSLAAIYETAGKYIEPAFRLKYQSGNGEDRPGKKTVRSKITIGTTSGIPGSPEVYGEIFYVYTGADLIRDKYRIGTSMKVRVISHHSLKIYGIYEKEISGDGDITRVAGLKYEYKF